MANEAQTCARCKKSTHATVDYLCLKCRAEVVGPEDDRETKPITIALGEEIRQPLTPCRNAPCTCGSNKKFKKCCYLADHERGRLQRLADDAERRRQWEEERAEEKRTGKRRPMSPATVALLGMVGAVAK